MPEEPPSSSVETALKLGYATQVGANSPPQSSRGGAAILLIGLTAISGFWSLLLGCLCLPDGWLFGVMLLATGICLCWATLGKLAPNKLRLGAALGMLTIALALEIPIFAIAHVVLQDQLLHDRNVSSGHEVSMCEIIRNTSLIPMALGAFTWVYVLVQLIAQRCRRAG